MKTVPPIREIEKIEKMKEILKAQNPRNYILFLLGIYLGRRISDILKFKAKDLHGKELITIKEQKTGKTITIMFHPELKKALDEYLQDKDPEEYVIGSREYTEYITIKEKVFDPKTNRKKSVAKKIKNTAPNSPISRVQAWNILNDAAKQVGINQIGCHSTRKTFGLFLYQKDKDIAVVQELLNHNFSSTASTRRYIGLTQIEMNNAVCGLPY